MPYKKKKLDFGFGFGLKRGQDPQQLVVPNLLDAQNVRFLKSSQICFGLSICQRMDNKFRYYKRL